MAKINKERFEIKIDADSYELIEQAAEVEGKTVNKFCKDAVIAAAKRVIFLHEQRQRETFPLWTPSIRA